MTANPHPNDLPPVVAAKLRSIRRREVALVLLRGLLLTLAVFLASSLVAMLLDWAAGWYDHRPRYLATLAALGLTAATFLHAVLRPLLRIRSLVDAAREVDQHLPQLEERWSTVTELAASTDSPEVRGSEAMIRQVASEAEAVSNRVVPEQVVPPRSLFRALRWFGGAAAAFALFFALNFSQANLLLQRFSKPGLDITLTRVTASPADTWVPKGEPLTLQATVTGRQPRQPAQLTVRTRQESAKPLPMQPASGKEGTYHHALDHVSDSFTYRVRAGDGQTAWHRIDAVDRPRITEVNLKVTPPAYSALPAEERTALPPSLRILEGTQLEVRFRADQDLDRLLLDLGGGQTLALTADADRWYRFQTVPTSNLTFTASAINTYQLENRTKPSCRITVFEDLPPAVKVLEPSDDVAVKPDDTVEVVFEATDDFGLAKAELLVTTTTSDGQTNQVTLEVPLGTDQGRKEVRKSIELDPKSLGLRHGDQLSYVVQVTDTRQTFAQAGASPGTPAPPGTPPDTSASQDPGENRDPSSDDSPNRLAARDADTQTSQAQAQAQAATDTAAEAKPGSGQGSAKPTELAAQPPSKPSESNPSQATPPPPNDMAMRTLDAGQCTTCQPRNITIDEWAGSFDGEQRKKLEIAIDPVLKQLETLLAEAQNQTETLKTPASSPDGLQAAHASHLAVARERVDQAIQVVGDLKSRTTGTPYAFIGLQLDNIRSAHVTPAGQRLALVSIPAGQPDANGESIEKAAFHLARARELLAELTRTYETVRREQQIADAMQKLNKMYQVFIEDTQALLGPSKGPINAYDRKVAEVDEAFVDKLKELLEERKKILAELAKLLAEDPRLLRRYLATLELQATSYRDQMTLLHRRQTQLHQEMARWNAAPEQEHQAFLAAVREAYAPGRRQVVQDAAKLRENLETWLPLDVPVDHPQVQAAFTQAEKAVQGAADSLQDTQAGHRALDALRALRESLPLFSDIPSTNQARMAAFISNRLPEIDALITAQSGQMRISEALAKGEFPVAAEVLQHGITQETVSFGDKLEMTEHQVASMSAEIAEKAALLNTIVQEEVIQGQRTSLDPLAERNVAQAETILGEVVPAFERAETVFDELMRLILAKLDEAPAPSGAGEAQDLESILAMLQDEQKAAEGLGIPCRPINVSVMRDWMRPSANSGLGSGMARAQAQAARAQAEQARAETERQERQARDRARQAAEGRAVGDAAEPGPAATRTRADAWNKLASQLRKDLMQGRDASPPEQYRDAIDHYFRTLAESPHAPGR